MKGKETGRRSCPIDKEKKLKKILRKKSVMEANQTKKNLGGCLE